MNKPFCRSCGKPIAKRTRVVHLKDRPYDERYDKSLSSWSRTINVDKLPETIEDCRPLTNLTITSVKRQQIAVEDTYPVQYHPGPIHTFHEWDGESYQSSFFCTTSCAEAFAYGVLKSHPTMATPAYREAIEKHAAKGETQ